MQSGSPVFAQTMASVSGLCLPAFGPSSSGLAGMAPSSWRPTRLRGKLSHARIALGLVRWEKWSAILQNTNQREADGHLLATLYWWFGLLEICWQPLFGGLDGWFGVSRF